MIILITLNDYFYNDYSIMIILNETKQVLKCSEFIYSWSEEQDQIIPQIDFDCKRFFD